MKRILIVMLMFVAVPLFARATKSEAPPSISSVTTSTQKLEGFMPLYWNAAGGKLLMEIPKLDTEILYQEALSAGVGSNPIGLDRAQPGDAHVVVFRRVGPKVLMIEHNYRFRALSDDPAERQSVIDSFAQSVLWGFEVVASEGQRTLVDATGFFLRDAHGVIDTLRETKQGHYTLDASRSAIFLDRTKSFPKNTEVEATLTFTTTETPGKLIRDVAPVAQSVTVREHHSLVELPDGNYKPREFDPRVGVYALEFNDYASSITEPVEKRWIQRHRLHKKDPAAAMSDPVEPIVYYVDNGAPEPIRSALVEGASWWNQAFEAAGYRNAFQVKVLPAGADPMDIRYNMVNWVHRSTRGWSYGGSIVDPRTGEIIKGNVLLGSLRVRQDYTIGSGLVVQNPTRAACGAEEVSFDYLASDASSDAKAMALARIRQLAAHEVGHTLGFEHNFAASTYGRASVMDYPAPMVAIKGGKLDLSNAYATGVGAYDKFVVRYAYSEFPPGTDEASALQQIVHEGLAAGMLFIDDADARPIGSAHPLASLWDNGDDPIAMLRHEMEVRKIALDQFGLANVRSGAPVAMLEVKLLPLYFHHRYELIAAAKSLGGVYFTYSVNEGGKPNPPTVRQIVAADRQRAALDAILDCLAPAFLAIPQRLLDLLPPKPFGYQDSRTEFFPQQSDPAFDPLGVASIAADLAISTIVEPHRDMRIVEQHAEDKSIPSLDDVFSNLVSRVMSPAPADDYQGAIAGTVQSAAMRRLVELARNPDASQEVRASATAALRKFDSMLTEAPGSGPSAALRRGLRDEIERFLARPDTPHQPTAPLPAPAGEPIG